MVTNQFRPVEEAVHRYIASQNMIQEGDKILVALSGGADSVFLLHFLHKFKKRYSITVAAAHLNHKLRSSAKKDALFCEDLCRGLGVEFVSEEADVKTLSKESKISVEMAAREMRYNFLRIASVKLNCIKIATAHHSDDNTETVMLNFLRGTGLAGIAGIPPVNGNIIRPLLSISKEEIYSYLNAKHLNFTEDETNAESEFARNFLRNKILPLVREKINPDIAAATLRNSEYFRGVNRFVQSATDNAYDCYCTRSEGREITDKKLLNEDPVIIQSVLYRQVEKIAGRKYAEFKVIEQLIRLLNKEAGKRIKLTPKVTVHSAQNGLVFVKDIQPEKFRNTIKEGETKVKNYRISLNRVATRGTNQASNPLIEYISLPEEHPVLVFRNREPGDYFRPIGLKGRKAVSDIVNEMKLPPGMGENVPVIEYKGAVIWVLGYRIAEEAKVTRNSKYIFRIDVYR